MPKRAVCTIISKNFLPYARVFTESYLTHNPGEEVYVLLCDRLDGFFDPAGEAFRLVTLDRLGIEGLAGMCFRYDVIEMSTAVKPFLLEYLLEQGGLDEVIYFDPDVMVFGGMGEVWRALEGGPIVLTPHITSPMPDDGKKPGELDILSAGTFNLGFIALRKAPRVPEFLRWWKERLGRYCYMDVADGFHVDQKWVDLAPAMFGGVRVLSDPGCNAAYWNLHERDARLAGGGLVVNGRPGTFFHFSGFNPHNIEGISSHQDRFTLSARPELRPLFESYQTLLLDKGFDGCIGWPYAFGSFDNGVRVPDAARKLYAGLQDAEAAGFGDPFETSRQGSFFEWLLGPAEAGRAVNRVCMGAYRSRPDVQAAYPDVFGKDIAGFLEWCRNWGGRELGLDEPFLPPAAGPETEGRPARSPEEEGRESLYAGLKAELDEKGLMLSRLQGRLEERESSLLLMQARLEDTEKEAENSLLLMQARLEETEKEAEKETLRLAGLLEEGARREEAFRASVHELAGRVDRLSLEVGERSAESEALKGVIEELRRTPYQRLARLPGRMLEAGRSVNDRFFKPAERKIRRSIRARLKKAEGPKKPRQEDTASFSPPPPCPGPPPQAFSEEPAPEELAWMSRTGPLFRHRPGVAAVITGAAADRPEDTMETLGRQVYAVSGIYSGLSDATGEAGGDWVLFVKAGTLVRPHAVYEIVMKLNLEPGLEFVYADEERAVDGGEPRPFFKPDWSPDLMLSMDYIGGFFAVKRDLLAKITSPADDLYDLALRLTEKAHAIGHVQKALFTSLVKNDAEMSEKRAGYIRDALKRRGVEAEVGEGASPGTFNVRRPVAACPRVSIIIPTAARDPEKLERCLSSIVSKSSYREFEIILMDNSLGGLDETGIRLPDGPHRVVRSDEAFNWSRVNNIGASHASGEYLLFMNDDMEVIAPGWLEALVENAQRPEVGVVGGKLLYPDNTVQHAGMFFVDHGGGARHMLPHVDGGSDAYFGFLGVQRNCSAVTGACLMTPRKMFDELGGFDEGLALTCNDTDFCLRAVRKGCLVVWTPHALLTHHEAVSRGGAELPEDHARFWARWRGFLDAGDPLYNPNLTLETNDLAPSTRPVMAEGRVPFLMEPGGIKNILVVKLDHLGDVILSFPAISMLRKKFPGAKITALVGGWARQVVAGNDDVDEMITYDFFEARSDMPPKGLDEAEKGRIRSWLGGYGFDLAIDLRKHPECREFLRLSGARYTAGFDIGDWKLTVALKGYGKYDAEHMSVQLCKLIASIPAGSDYMDVPLIRPAGREDAVRAVSKVLPHRDGGLLVGVHAGAGNAVRKWPEGHFARLSDMLIEREGAEVVFFGGPDDADTVERIMGLMRNGARAHNAAGVLSLDEFMAAATLCGLFIGNVSGPMHMAAAAGAPTLGIFPGVVLPHEWAPLGLHLTVRLRVSCALCDFAAPAQCPYGLKCLDYLNPEQAYMAARRLLAFQRAHQAGHAGRARGGAGAKVFAPVAPRELGVNVVGYLTGEFGLGAAARADVRCLASEGIPCAPINYTVGHHSNEDATVGGLTDRNPYEVNLVHINMDVVKELVREKGRGFFTGKYNIAYWVWESHIFPERFRDCLGLFDEVWTPSSFSQGAISRATSLPVIRMPHAVDIAETAVPDRRRFGLKDDEFVFLVMFDFYSQRVRKNPAAAVRAFRAAFGKKGRARLVVKHINSEKRRADLDVFNREIAGTDAMIISRHMRAEEAASLMASCDCYVSLHRSEGFGLTIAEAMALGKPVIATDYSGNTDFMDLTNSFPVRYDAVRMEDDLPPYVKGSVWAEPDVAHAAELMKLVCDDREAREAVSRKAALDMKDYTSKAVGRLFRRRLEDIARLI